MDRCVRGLVEGESEREKREDKSDRFIANLPTTPRPPPPVGAPLLHPALAHTFTALKPARACVRARGRTLRIRKTLSLILCLFSRSRNLEYNAHMASACKAVAVLRGEAPAHSSVAGFVQIYQAAAGQPATRISGRVSGLAPGSRHGLRVLAYGDELEGARTMGGTFNPFLKNHGDREDEERPVGALGNIEAGPDGVAVFDFLDRQVTLVGPLSVIGRGVGVTASEDDGGKGGHPDSQADGHAGQVIAAGVIGMSAIPLPS